MNSTIAATRTIKIDEYPPCLAKGGVLQQSDPQQHKISRQCLEAVEVYNNVNSASSRPQALEGGKVVLVGDSMVGKTSLYTRHLTDLFKQNYKPTVALDFNVQNYEICGVQFSLSIWDTAGQERFRSLAKTFYRGSHACLAVFDLNDSKTLDHIEEWCNEMRQHCGDPNALLFIVGNKSDLYNQTDPERVAAIATKLKAEYWEVSALNNVNVKELFNRITYLVWEKQIIQFKENQNRVLALPDLGAIGPAIATQTRKCCW